MITLEPQETVLSHNALIALEDLKKSNIHSERLKDRLQKAVGFITSASAQLNDRGLEHRKRHQGKQKRLINNGETEDDDERRQHDDFQKKVGDLTNKMDFSIRQVIDDRVWLEGVSGAIGHVRQKASTVSRGRISTQMTTQQTEDDMALDQDEDEEGDRPLIQPDPSEAPTAVLDAAFSTNQIKWLAKSLTDRYSEHNDYIGWYRIVYDANHPGEDAPPLPHASMWFAAEENREATTVPRGSQNHRQQTKGRRRAGQEDDDAQSDSESDIEIAAERVSIKCPITLLPFKDPMASTKCPHAFEKNAILDMFKHTTDHIPFTAEQQIELSQRNRPQERAKRERELRVPMVRCPECSVPLSKIDLRPDPVLLRKVHRQLEKDRRTKDAEEGQDDDVMDAEDDDEDEPPRGTQRRNIVHVGSSPAPSMRRQSGRTVKPER